MDSVEYNFNPFERSEAGPAVTEPIRLLSYCHEGTGVGHLSRSLAISERLTQVFPNLSGLLVTGSPFVSLFPPPPRVDWLKLPTLKKVAGGTYRPKSNGLPMDDLMCWRSSILLSTVRAFRPHLVIVDKAPGGVCGEMKPALCWLRRSNQRAHVVFGMRDIEDTPEAVAKEWTRAGTNAILENLYDEVWIYGMKRVFDAATIYGMSDSIRDKIFYTGYLCRSCDHAKTPAAEDHKELLVTVGGGSDGENLIDLFLSEAARRTVAAGFRPVIVGGPDLPPATASRLRAKAAQIPGVHWSDSEQCLVCRIRRACGIVTMGGYNTMSEIVSQGKRALVVPRTTPRLEQYMRGSLWSDLGAIKMVEPEGLTPHRLAERVMDLVKKSDRPVTDLLDFNGLHRIGERVARIVEDRIPSEAIKQAR